jgi:hypothetical protein
MKRKRGRNGGWVPLDLTAISARNYEKPVEITYEMRLRMRLKVMECMTLTVDPTNGAFYIRWGEGVPEQYKVQMKASFGAMFAELPSDAIVTNPPKVTA